jgi:hypothetical protein
VEEAAGTWKAKRDKFDEDIFEYKVSDSPSLVGVYHKKERSFTGLRVDSRKWSRTTSIRCSVSLVHHDDMLSDPGSMLRRFMSITLRSSRGGKLGSICFRSKLWRVMATGRGRPISTGGVSGCRLPPLTVNTTDATLWRGCSDLRGPTRTNHTYLNR